MSFSAKNTYICPKNHNPNVFDMTKREIELLLFYQETEARNLKLFIKKASEEGNQTEIDYFLDKLKAIIDKIEHYKKLLAE